MVSELKEKLQGFIRFLRVIILHPRNAWIQLSDVDAVDEGNHKPFRHVWPDVKRLMLRVALPLSLIPALANVIGWGLIGRTYRSWAISTTVKDWDYAFSKGLVSLLTSMAAIFLVALAIDQIAPSFRSEKNFLRSFKLIVYSWIPVWIGGIFNLIPAVAWISNIVSLYALVLLYTGLPVMKRTHDESRTSYFVIIALAMAVVYNLLYMVLGAIIGSLWVNPSSVMTSTF